ncbi:arginine--tRNA ligase: cytoplasmic-like isoform X1 [Dinothrombium tinctorium]|uniref:Probable arginine--tRNA ligase, cytoplasmic n=1 Tax=Dinothrombium tinctorium TaxID=1965070 RepID=A0A3S3P259_9ACAR|nr:arginine--tRNA ligase: cytoplasmic-like isoform X1 [Dinothrombium tinctorium]
MSTIVDHLKNAENNCSAFERRLNEAKRYIDPEDKHAKSEWNSLQVENAKIKYRLNILKRSLIEDGLIDSQTCTHTKDSEKKMQNLSEDAYLCSFLHTAKNLFEKAITSSCQNLTNPPISVTQSQIRGVDYQCNSAMQIIKKVRDEGLILSDGSKLSPKDIAESIVRHIPKNDVFSTVAVAPPGFINVTIDQNYICKKIRDLLVYGVHVKPEENRKRILVDYSSPNIAKEMHVGHLRSTIIGDCIANIFEFLGHDVLRVNHVGDWGTQFGMLLAHLTDKYPDFLTNPPPISNLQAFYKEAKVRFDNEEEFKKQAYSCVVRLQAKEPDMYTAWKQICEISRKEFQKVYDILGIKNLTEKGESYYHDLMVDVVNDLEKRNLIEDSEGRKIFNSSEGHLLMVKSDGGFTYDTSDLACVKYRIEVEKADKIIYVTDKGQQNHFMTLFECARKATYCPPNVELVHVGFGVVIGDDNKKFKTRSGDTVRLLDLLEEGMKRALAKLKEKGRDEVLTEDELNAAKAALAVGCIKYADISHDLTLDYKFSFDRMLDDRGNTAVYLLYSLTRIRSIIKKANVTTPVEQLAREVPALKLQHPREIRLAKYVLKFPEIILQVANELRPHTLCSYLFDLSVVFSEFYEQCYCIEKVVNKDGETTKVNFDRIMLCEATASVMSKALNILGIETLSKM